MPETNESEVPTTSPIQKRNERTEAKFLEDVEKLIAEAERLGADYKPPGSVAGLTALKAKRDAVITARSANQANAAAEETMRNRRENLYKSLSADVTSLLNYAKSAGIADNDVAALRTIAREIKGGRAKPLSGEGGNHISVSQLSFASRADNYAEFIEQYEALSIPTEEEMYKPATHRTRLAALREANNDIIAAESASNSSGEALDKLAYSDADSLLNSCVSAKTYIKSKYGTRGQPYLNIAKTRFVMPSRLRRS
jgi:hypothetical protein